MLDKDLDFDIVQPLLTAKVKLRDR